jgi:hypothetical protein
MEYWVDILFYLFMLMAIVEYTHGWNTELYLISGWSLTGNLIVHIGQYSKVIKCLS